MSVLQYYKIFNAKRILQSHTHLVRVMNALANGDNLALFLNLEPQDY